MNQKFGDMFAKFLFVFFIWTFINLVPRAISHHKWYKDNFKDYPKNRKAIIPKLL